MRLIKHLTKIIAACLLACLWGATALAQGGDTVSITGIVQSEQDELLADASVQLTDTVTGKTMNTLTNNKGIFVLNGVKTGSQYRLSVSFTGFETKTMAHFKVEAAVKNTLMIRLREAAGSLENIVVVGYGTQKKVNLTGAVSQIGPEVLQDRPVNNVIQALQGTVPNLNISFGDGSPASSITVNIRGYASINSVSGSPLILIDGVPGSLNLVNPNDVESISVLKDAASSAIYGARGAFGVVLVTTKSAKAGKSSVSYHSNFGQSTPTVNTNFITDGYTAAKLVDDAFSRAVGRTYTGYTDDDYAELLKRQTDKTLPSVVIDNRAGKDMYIYYGNTDWWATMFRKWEPSMEHALSFTGGNDKTNYLVSGRYYQKKGIMQINQDTYHAYNFRAKINTKVTDWFTLHTNTQFNTKDYAYPGWGVNNNFVSITVHALPSYVPRNPDGTATYRTELNNYTIGDGIFADLLHGKSKGGTREYQLINTVGATLQLAKGLTLDGNYSFTLLDATNFQRRTEAPWSIYPGVISYVGYDQLNEHTRTQLYHVVNAYATYTKSFGNHHVKLMAGYNQELNKTKDLDGYRKELLSEELNDINLGTGDYGISGGHTEWALLGVFGRLNYDYKGRYLLEMNGRYDGTSRFKEGDRFGFFPSVSAGWRIDQEPFFAKATTVANSLKLRASYGSLGNQQTSNYAYISSMSHGTMSYLVNGQKIEYFSLPSPVSASLTWEEATSTDIGLDVAFLHNRLSVSADWYRRTTTRMLTKGKTLPAVFGASEPNENAADLLTKGYEVTIGWKDQLPAGKSSFSYYVNAVLSDYTSTITRFDNPTKLLSDYYEGEQLGEIWGYSIDGLFASDKEAADYEAAIPLSKSMAVHKQISNASGEWSKLRAGDMRFVDVNGDGEISLGANTLDDHGDLKRIGNAYPRYSFGLNMGASWNGLDFSAFFQGIGRQNWYPGNNADKFWGPYSRPYFSFIPADFPSKIWSEDNPNSYFPLLRGYTALNSGGDLMARNDRYIQNLAYVRLKNLTLGYSLPNALLRRMKLQRFRIYVSGENILTFTALDTKYIDPEQAAADANGRVYPFSKTLSFGLDLSL